MIQGPPDDSPAARTSTLGDVLYGAEQESALPEQEWSDLVRAVAAGDQLALHALYERAHRMVFTLAMRLTDNRQAAEAVTLDVFLEVWREAASYDPRRGSVLAWIMESARRRAIQHGQPDRHEQALQRALQVLAPDEREAIEAAFFGDLCYAEVAERLALPVPAVKKRIHAGLVKLQQALAVAERSP